MSFDATDLEIARREHAAEMGESSPSEQRWLRFCEQAEARLVALGWTDARTGIDADDDVEGFSIDFAYEAWERGETVTSYVDGVRAKRIALGLLSVEAA